jgi:UDP-glucose 4-epimerase
MKLVVTGGAGYIGSICVEQLLNEGYEVAVIDNLTEGHKDAIDPRAKFFHTDLSDREAIFKIFQDLKPEGVMHFAANALVGESMQNPSKYYRNNVSAPLNLLDAMVAVDCKKLVFSSTCATYGMPKEVPIGEDTVQNPINPYGHSKLILEQIIKWYHQIHGIKYTFLRYFNAAGASEKYGEHHKVESHLIPTIIQVALGQRPKISVFGNEYPTPDGTCVRDYIHILDLAQAHILALHDQESNAYNLGNGDGYSVLEVIEEVERVSGKDIPVEIQAARPGDPAKLIANASKAKNILKWKPQYPKLNDIVTTAWNWHVKNPHGYKN